MRKTPTPPEQTRSRPRRRPSNTEPDRPARDDRAHAQAVRAGAIETDLTRLKQLAQSKERAHLQLRTDLKMGPMPSKKVDALFHRFNAEVSAAVDCTLCANCCVVSSPVLERSDVERLARRLGMSPDQVHERYLREAEDGDVVFAAQPCPFLESKRCSVYEDRPADCRSFPHLDKTDMVSRLWMVIGNAQICPIAYEVLERVRRAGTVR